MEYKLPFATLLVVSSLFSSLVACSSTSSNGSGAGDEGSSGAATQTSPTDPAACRSCSKALADDNGNNLCTAGSPSSADVFNRYFACACIGMCKEVCGGNKCKDGTKSTSCDDCLATKCSAEKATCESN